MAVPRGTLGRARSLPRMTIEIGFVLCVLVVALVLFVKEWFSPDGVAVGILVALVVGRVLTPKEAFQSFGNEALITVAAMFVIAAGLVRTGALGFLSRQLMRLGNGSPKRMLLALLVASAACSAFVNNTPIVVIFLPIALGLAETMNVAPSKLLIPLAYAAIVGGMCTIIGTSTSLLVSTALPQYGMAPLDFFEPLPLAIVGVVMTLVYLLTLGNRLLPTRMSLATGARGGKIHEYVTELEVPGGSAAIGKTIDEAVTKLAQGVRVLQLIRREEIKTPEGKLVLQEGDTLLLKGDVNALLDLQRSGNLLLSRDLASPEFRARARDITLAELLVRPPSTAVGERVRDLNLYSRHGVAVLAVQRHGFHIREKVGELRLRVGDVLLVQAEAKALEDLRDARNFLLLESVREKVTLPHKAWLAMTTIAVVVALATLELESLPISVLSVAGAAIMVAGGCLSVRDAYRALDMPILVLIAGTLCLGLAMDKSGTASWIAGGLSSVVAPLGSVGLLSAIYLITNLLTAMISNNGSALLMLPIALETAQHNGLSPLAFIVAVMFAASIDFSTPIGYQVNTIVYGPGGYRFADYLKVGVPLNLMWWILATLLIPVFWPLELAV